MKKTIKLNEAQLKKLIEDAYNNTATCLPDDPRVDAAIVDLVELCIEVLGDNGALGADSFDSMHAELNNVIRDALAPFEW